MISQKLSSLFRIAKLLVNTRKMSLFSQDEVVTVDLATVLLFVDLAQHRGRSNRGRLQSCVVDQLLDSILKKSLPIGTELLIAAYLSRVNFTNIYQQKVAKKLTRYSFTTLIYDFDCSTKLNQRLIQMCVEKEIFSDAGDNNVTVTLMMYAKKLQELQSLAADVEPNSTDKLTEYKISQDELLPPSGVVPKNYK